MERIMLSAWKELATVFSNVAFYLLHNLYLGQEENSEKYREHLRDLETNDKVASKPIALIFLNIDG